MVNYVRYYSDLFSVPHKYKPSTVSIKEIQELEPGITRRGRVTAEFVLHSRL